MKCAVLLSALFFLLPFVGASDGKLLIVRQKEAPPVFEAELRHAIGALQEPWLLDTEYICEDELDVLCPCKHLQKAIGKLDKTRSRKQILILAIEDQQRQKKACPYQAYYYSPIVLQLFNAGPKYQDLMVVNLSSPAGHIYYEVLQADFFSTARNIIEIVRKDRKYTLRHPKVKQPDIFDDDYLIAFIRICTAMLSVIGSILTPGFNVLPLLVPLQ